MLAAVKAQLDFLTEYKDVFEDLGHLPGEYNIVTDESVKPVIHPPRRVPVSLRDQIKAKLDEMVQQDIITPVTEPSACVSSMMVVVKPDKFRICINPKDLNRVMCREQYQMPMLEEVAKRLTNAKNFTVLIRWNRIRFGISSASEVWQRTMHEFVEDMDGVEVIAEGFLFAGFGKTDVEVLRSLKANKRAFFEKCRMWNLKLNRRKVKCCQSSVRSMGHLLTSDRLKADPEKIQAIN